MLEVLGAFALFAAIAYLALGRDPKRSKQKARLARVTRRGPRAVAASGQSLRRRDPNAGNALGQALAGISIIGKLQARMQMAGIAMTPQKLLGIAGSITLATLFVVCLLLHKSLLIGLLIGGVLGLGLPHLYVRRKLRKRQLMFLKLFPDAIDLMVRGLRAGLPIAESFQTVSREIPPPVGDMFANVSQQVALGVPLEKALADAGGKVDLTEFNFFVTTVILQRETGGNLGEILSNLSEMLRQRQMMKLKIGALSSEARASAYIVGALPFAVFGLLAVFSPAYLSPLFHDFRGNMALSAAGGMMGFGGFVMKRMTMFEI